MTRPRLQPATQPAAPGVRRAALPVVQLSLQFADGSHRGQLPRHHVRRWIRAALREGQAQITVRVVGAAEGQALNRDYRGKDNATNVLTFSYQTQPTVVADLVLCAPVVQAEAKQQRLDVAAHYAHLIVHGTLHAQGLDHDTDTTALAMEQRESSILLALGFGDPYESNLGAPAKA